MYSIREASELLNLKVRTIRWYISVGKLAARKDKRTKRWKISKKAIKEFIRDHKN